MKHIASPGSGLSLLGQKTHRPDGRSKRREIWPVPPVPFSRDNRIDERALDELVEFYVRAGVDGLFILAYSGEVFELNTEEQLLVCRRVIERAAGRLRIVAAGNFGGNLPHQIEQLNRIADVGPAAVVVLLSTLPDESRLMDDLISIAGQVSAPLGVYECPVPSHRLLSPADVGVLADTGRYVFMKETSRDRNVFLAKLAAAEGSPLTLYQANWGQLAKTIDDGCPGFCGIVANVFPELADAFCNSDSLTTVGRQALHEILGDALTCMTQRHYPATMKYVLQRQGLKIGTTSRMPGGQDVDADDIRRLDDALEVLGLLRAPDVLIGALSKTDDGGSSTLRGPHRPAEWAPRELTVVNPSDID